jgi:hypothetical protein
MSYIEWSKKLKTPPTKKTVYKIPVIYNIPDKVRDYYKQHDIELVSEGFKPQKH